MLSPDSIGTLLFFFSSNGECHHGLCMLLCDTWNCVVPFKRCTSRVTLFSNNGLRNVPMFHVLHIPVLHRHSIHTAYSLYMAGSLEKTVHSVGNTFSMLHTHETNECCVDSVPCWLGRDGLGRERIWCTRCHLLYRMHLALEIHDRKYRRSNEKILVTCCVGRSISRLCDVQWRYCLG